jgi:hypothetical protein
MNYSDFIGTFDDVDVCIWKAGMDDLVLDVMEERGALGPCSGCMWGCFKYWACCCGLYKLWCARKSDMEMVDNMHRKVAPSNSAMERDAGSDSDSDGG